MKRRKPTVDDYISAILDRYRGTPYDNVLVIHDITPLGFHRAVMYRLDDFIEATEKPGIKRTLEEIAEDDEKKREMFNMGEDCIREQYDRIQKGTQKQFYQGTHINRRNMQFLAYHALTKHHPELDSIDRKQVVDGIKGLPFSLAKYMHKKIKIGGLMISIPDMRDSPLGVLELFDEIRQEKTGDASLFDLTQKEHLHKWGDRFMAPLNYWKDPANREEAVYHTLTEHRPELASKDRETVVEGIKKLPTNLQNYFNKIGLNGLAKRATKRYSPLAILEVFDIAYQKETGDASLFDLSQKYHLHKGGGRFMAPLNYWKDPANREEAVYHTLTEDMPKLGSRNRSEVIQGIKELPISQGDYFRYTLKLDGLMHSEYFQKEAKRRKINYPRVFLEIFDRAYQRITGDVSLFDKRRGDYLEFSANDRLIRK